MMGRFLFLLCAIAITVSGITQQTKEEIQKKQQDLQRELAELNNNLSEIKKNKKQSIGQLVLVQRKIKAREALINNINDELKKIDDEIYQNNLEIYRYRRELDTLKESYAKSLVFAYKNRSNYDYLNFIFSSTSFNDAIKRVAYLKSYKQYRETQVENIMKTQDLLTQKLGDLSVSKTKKNNTLEEQGKQLQQMETDRKEKDQVVKELKSQETELASEIKSKEKDRKKLQQSLQAAIKREIAEAARREREKQATLAKQQEADRQRKLSTQQATTDNTPNNTTATAATKPADKNDEPVTGMATGIRSNRTYSPLESTQEGLTQSLNFEGNHGRLPWPVSTGYISSPFGVSMLPGTKIKVNNPGIDISLPVGTSVKSVADGEVSSVFDVGGGELAVIIRHGKYFTTYSHLSSTSVNRGDAVKAGTVLGHAGTDDNGDGILSFMVSNEKFANLNPELWLRPR